MARQHDVYQMPGGTMVVVIQSDLLASMRTRVVMPLLPENAFGPPIRNFNIPIRIGSTELMLMPQLMATLTLSELGARIGSVADQRDEITRAVDTLLSGL